MNSTDPFPDAPNATWPPPGALAGNGTALREGLHVLVHTATLVTCTLLLVIVFCLGSYGNFIVFLSFFDPAFRKFRTNFDFMILNLSFCDLFVCGVTAPMFAFVLFFGSVPAAFCFAFHLTGAGFILMSLKTVAVIALHRLRMVLGKQPNRTASFPCTLLLALLLWATSFTLATVATLKTRTPPLCLPMSSLAAGEGRAVLSLYVVDFAFCVAVVSVSYITIAQTLRKNAQVRKGPPVITVDASRPQPFVGAPAEGGGDPVQCAAPALYRNQNYNKLQHVQTHGYAQGPGQLPTPAASRLQLVSAVNLSAAKDSKAVVTCVVIVLSVLVCCLPLGISLVQVVLSGSGSFILYQFELFGFTLIFLKSGLNPFIYSRNSTGLRRKVLWCLQCVGLGFFCCRQKTRLRAMGKGNLEVNRNKSSHHETNSAYMLSPKPQKKFVDQACGPSHSKESVVSPKFSAGGHQLYGQSSSTPINTRMEPYYSIYNSSPSQEESLPCHLQPVSAFGFASSYVAMHYHTTNDLLQECDSASARQIPVPSV
ncbi:probable G-protein coupled receptor 75 [Pipistrellus kuhlii]|uniref:G protein-coupled receptor 75 n=1 Tax=Pipistrellus kuhlii TaxID=59472 RepID=A0A7J7VUR1_PIPKU|nr:probable G-protein coupled receptor 75 [Pipistrellus kuhlii]KAF6328813.1 G protein-coupled receptor 75 [Pipistrellus kuhlii]